MASIGGGVQANLDRCGFCHISCSLEGRHETDPKSFRARGLPGQALKSTEFSPVSVALDRPMASGQTHGWPVSRILSPAAVTTVGRPFIFDTCLQMPVAAYPDPRAKASPRTHTARDPYSALLPVGLAMPVRLPDPRWALTPPFHPCPVFRAVCSLWRFPSDCPGRVLPGTVALWSPDFPPTVVSQPSAAVQPSVRQGY